MEKLEEELSSITLDKPYERMLLKKLDNEKGILSSEECKQIIKEKLPSDLIFHTNNLDYFSLYYYNCESIEDLGWGCAWRAIQTSLSHYKTLLKDKNKVLNDFTISFEKLFLSFGKRETLLNLFIKSYQSDNKEIPDYLTKIKFAPFETKNGWAEPFLAKLIFSHFDIQGDLFLINQWPSTAYAPQEVFSKTITFKEFIPILEEHFSHANASPIVIDDSIVTMCIGGLAYDKEQKKYHIIIYDPHVRKDELGSTGIYEVILNEEGVFEPEVNKQPTILGKKIDFSIKGWMIFKPSNI